MQKESFFSFYLIVILYLCIALEGDAGLLLQPSKRLFLMRFTTHYLNLLKLGLPIVVGQLGQIVLGFADTLMIGHHSTTELAAAAFVNTMFALVLITALGFSYGLTPVVGTLYGQGQMYRIGSVVKNAWVTNGLVALGMMALMTVLYHNIHRLGQPEELLPLMRPYFLVQLVSLPFVMLFNAMKQFFDGITKTQVPMWVMLISNVVNIVGNWLLIFGVGPFPELGLLGAGIATLISRILMALLLVSIFFVSMRFKDYRQGFCEGRLNRKDFVQLNQLGFPLALQMGMETSSFSLTSIFVGWLGTSALAAHQIMLTISQLFFMVYYGMAAAVSVYVSHYRGKHDYDSLLRVSQAGFHLIIIIACSVSIPVFLLRGQIGYYFTDSSEVSALVTACIIPLMVYQFGDGLQCNYANALRGLSHVRPMMFIAFVAYFVVSLPLAYVFAFILGAGLIGIWWSFLFGLTTAGVLYYFAFQRQYRRIITNKV